MTDAAQSENQQEDLRYVQNHLVQHLMNVGRWRDLVDESRNLAFLITQMQEHRLSTLICALEIARGSGQLDAEDHAVAMELAIFLRRHRHWLERFPHLLVNQGSDEWRSKSLRKALQEYRSRFNEAPVKLSRTRGKGDDATLLTAYLGATPLTSCEYSPDGEWILVGDERGLVRLIGTATGAVKKVFTGSNERVIRCGFINSGVGCFAFYGDGKVITWDIYSGKEIRRHADLPFGLSLSRRGFLGRMNGWMGVSALDMEMTADMSEDGSTLLIGGAVLHLTQGGWLTTIDMNQPRARQPCIRNWYSTGAHEQNVSSCRIGRESQTLASIAGDELTVWQMSKGKAPKWRPKWRAAVSGDEFLAIEFSSDYGVLASITRGGVWTMQLAKNGEIVDKKQVAIGEFSMGIVATAISRQLDMIVFGTDCGAVFCVQSKSLGQNIEPIGCGGLIAHCAISRAGDQFATVGADGVLRSWMRLKGDSSHSFGQSVIGSGWARFAAHQDRVFVATNVGSIVELVDSSACEVTELTHCSRRISACAVSKDDRLAVASHDGDLEILTRDEVEHRWIPQKLSARGKELRHKMLAANHLLSSLLGLALSGAVRGATIGLIVVGLWFRPFVWIIARLWSGWQGGRDLESNVVLWMWFSSVVAGVVGSVMLSFRQAFSSGWIRTLAFSSDGNWLATGSSEGVFKIWNTKDGSEHVVLHFEPQVTTFGVAVRQLARRPLVGPRTLLDWWSSIRWRSMRGKSDPAWSDPSGEVSGILACCYSSDGQFLAAASTNGPVRVWRLSPCISRIVELRFLGFQTRCLLFHPCSQRLLVGGSGGEMAMVLIPECMFDWRITAHESALSCMEFSPDGNAIASASSDETVRLWSSRNGELLVVYHVGGPVVSLSWHSSGRRLLATDKAGRLIEFSFTPR